MVEFRIARARSPLHLLLYGELTAEKHAFYWVCQNTVFLCDSHISFSWNVGFVYVLPYKRARHQDPFPTYHIFPKMC